MAVYPEIISSFNQFSNEEIIALHRLMTDYASQLSFTLQQRDDQIDSEPANGVSSVNNTADVQSPAEGSVRYNRATSKFQGYISGTGWVDFH
jgi:hypothetical protein|tara:strand:- start:200 stop:475 length:276 start_codon:yes stop_codon:yes gene_type:complete